MYRYHFSMRDNFHYGDERILLGHIQEICFNSLLSALIYFQICIKHSSYCDEFSSKRGKKRALASKRLEISYLAQNFFVRPLGCYYLSIRYNLR